MRDGLIISALSVLPKKTTTKTIGVLSRLRLPRPLHNLLVRLYVFLFQVDLTECDRHISEFDSLSEFFSRPLKPGLRPIDSTPNALVSPVDATVHGFGRITGGQFGQSDSRSGSIHELVGTDKVNPTQAHPLTAGQFDEGWYAILYLSPTDYHRVHCPRSAKAIRCRYLPGHFWPVFPTATRRVKGLFDRNERLLFQLHSDRGGIVVAMIGAFGVAHMRTPIADINPDASANGMDIDLSPPTPLDRGQEIGRFGMGSTVIVLVEPVSGGSFQWNLEPGQPVKVGIPIGHWS